MEQEFNSKIAQEKEKRHHWIAGLIVVIFIILISWYVTSKISSRNSSAYYECKKYENDTNKYSDCMNSFNDREQQNQEEPWDNWRY